MTKDEFLKLPAAKRREVASLVYTAILKQEPGPRKHCFACGEDFPERTFSEINDEGDKVCERCIFILALYAQNGIKKKITAGNLHPRTLNAKFRKIVEEDFYMDPAAAYQRFLGAMIQEEERKQRIIWITPAEIRKIADDFPFFLMTDAEFQQFRPEEGADLTLRTRTPEKGRPDTIRRRIYAIHKITGRAAKKYSGSADRKHVCFIPEVYDK